MSRLLFRLLDAYIDHVAPLWDRVLNACDVDYRERREQP